MISLILNGLKLINWFAGKIDQAEWKKEGRQELFNEQLEGLRKTITVAEKSFEDAKAATPKDRRKSLEDSQ